MIKRIVNELVRHIPFTALGAVTGIIITVIAVFSNFSPKVSYNIFYILHPIHVVLSALVTVAMCRKHSKGKLWAVVLIGYMVSVGIGTISDSLIPYLGEALLGLPNKGLHIGFIEEWWLVNPLALIGIAIGYWRPDTRLPHSGHILVSTWASLFHVIMALLGTTVNWVTLLVIFLFLFLAVWLPCCLGDIVFPLLLIREVATPEHISYNHNHSGGG